MLQLVLLILNDDFFPAAAKKANNNTLYKNLYRVCSGDQPAIKVGLSFIEVAEGSQTNLLSNNDKQKPGGLQYE
jgi:hypothetical protein